MTIGANIRRFRLDAGMSQDELAQKLNCTRSAVTQWEVGNSNPRLSTLQQIALVFGVQTGDLVGDASSMPFGSRRPAASTGQVRVRRLGKTHAGEAIEELEDEEDVYIPQSVLDGHANCFALQVVGNCMSRVYPDGCTVIVDPEADPWNGCAVIAETEPGESVMRRFYRGNDTIILSADCWDGDYPDIVVGSEDYFRIIGIVIWFQSTEEERAEQTP